MLLKVLENRFDAFPDPVTHDEKQATPAPQILREAVVEHGRVQVRTRLANQFDQRWYPSS